MRVTRGWRLGIAIGAALAISGLAIGMVAGSIPGEGNVIYGCYKADGDLRVIDYPRVICGPKDTLISWNQKGEPGSDGAQGPTGANGATGPQGATGATGPAGGGGGSTIRPDVGKVSITGHSGSTIATDLGFVDFDWTVISPRDAGTGQATGRRQHKPLAITMHSDAAEVRLFGAIFSNETLPTVHLGFFEPGGATPYLTIDLVNGSAASVAQVTEDGAEYAEVSFTYQRITLTWEDGTVSQDDWADLTS